MKRTSLAEPLPSATYRNNVERDPPKQKPLRIPRKAKRKKGSRK